MNDHRTEEKNKCATPARQRAELSVEPLSDDRFRVTGGSAPRIVTLTLRGVECDCPSYMYRGGPCKHGIAVAESLNAAAKVEPDQTSAHPMARGTGPGLERDIPLPDVATR